MLQDIYFHASCLSSHGAPNAVFSQLSPFGLVGGRRCHPGTKLVFALGIIGLYHQYDSLLLFFGFVKPF